MASYPLGYTLHFYSVLISMNYFIFIFHNHSSHCFYYICNVLKLITFVVSLSIKDKKMKGSESEIFARQEDKEKK